MDLENTQIQMRKGILEFCILHIISRGEVYSSDILRELKEARIIVVEGTLYPLLNRLRKAELVDYSWKESSSGPPQKHFQLTSKGEDFLVRLNETWIELVESVNQIITKSRVEAFHHKLPKLEIEALKIKRK
jgi:PadR family transcriptional regulator PadR